MKELRNLSVPRLARFALVMLALSSAACSTVKVPEGGYVFYPPPPQRPRVQFLARFAGARDIEPESRLMKFLVGETQSARRFRKPTGVAAGNGKIYVADPGWETVLVIDLEERTFETLGDHGEGKLLLPVVVALDEAGHTFVADTGRKQVVQFDAEGAFVHAYGVSEEFLPTGVAVDDRRLYVSDRRANNVVMFDRRNKKMVGTIGRRGDRPGEFSTPTSLTLDSRGHLFVTDMTNFRIQEFDGDGEFVQAYGFLGDGPGTFARPKGTAIDRDGHLYVVDAAFENVQIWDTSNAQVLMAFGGSGIGPGSMYLPGSVAISYELSQYFTDRVSSDFDLEYVILVANNYGPNKVGVYGFVTPKDPDSYVERPLPSEDDQAGEADGE